MQQRGVWTGMVAADAQSIYCCRCGQTSQHPEDVRHGYCGRCHAFHEQFYGGTMRTITHTAIGVTADARLVVTQTFTDGSEEQQVMTLDHAVQFSSRLAEVAAFLRSALAAPAPAGAPSQDTAAVSEEVQLRLQ